ncbi:hypothetical protein BCV69DRAFT_151455 [Microstroma glucosiphilum]|uniref:Uncharacterized protein n=1 Tax=Pseudomicrostroma glucosiphilum TaxID=1684307 RepID=A0A316UBN5_9BASI|nr:hypothetical protein BCV69DRAFT_151455 [Pseudomicrostroma glucosiphilum]PWN22606.1 hypothetical protein BCV69DRAFT_151455 [Pseudomicrostroma glucosiphilum]
MSWADQEGLDLNITFWLAIQVVGRHGLKHKPRHCGLLQLLKELVGQTVHGLPSPAPVWREGTDEKVKPKSKDRTTITHHSLRRKTQPYATPGKNYEAAYKASLSLSPSARRPWGRLVRCWRYSVRCYRSLYATRSDPDVQVPARDTNQGTMPFKRAVVTAQYVRLHLLYAASLRFP